MGLIRSDDAVALVVAAFSRNVSALEWASKELIRIFGPTALVSPLFDFHQTRYYESSMGKELRKQFLVLHQLVSADGLGDIKRRTNEMEAELARSGNYPEVRPLNLDPGILTLGKFMLATTKDQSHRIYLNDGIFAEVTLRFHAGTYEPWPWTYADYREPDVISFLNDAREWYRKRLGEPRG